MEKGLREEILECFPQKQTDIRMYSPLAQAQIGDAIQELLTEEEARIYRRGRNANPYHHAKNATLEEYLKATALETLCGYLYLKDETARFLELLKAGIERAGIG